MFEWVMAKQMKTSEGYNHLPTLMNALDIDGCELLQQKYNTNFSAFFYTTG